MHTIDRRRLIAALIAGAFALGSVLALAYEKLDFPELELAIKSGAFKGDLR